MLICVWHDISLLLSEWNKSVSKFVGPYFNGNKFYLLNVYWSNTSLTWNLFCRFLEEIRLRWFGFGLGVSWSCRSWRLLLRQGSVLVPCSGIEESIHQSRQRLGADCRRAFGQLPAHGRIPRAWTVPVSHLCKCVVCSGLLTFQLGWRNVVTCFSKKILANELILRNELSIIGRNRYNPIRYYSIYLN